MGYENVIPYIPYQGFWTPFRQSTGLGEQTKADSLRSAQGRSLLRSGQPFAAVLPDCGIRITSPVAVGAQRTIWFLRSVRKTSTFVVRLFPSRTISWIQGVVTRWEKQHGPIPKKR